MSGYIPVTKLDDLDEARATAFEVKGTPIILCLKDGDVFALEGRCSHAFKSLDGARVRGNTIMCPHHGARYEIETGKHVAPPAVWGLKKYNVRIGEGGMVEVSLLEGQSL